MSNDDDDYDWFELYEINKSILPHPSRIIDGDINKLPCFPFCLTLQELDIPFNKKDAWRFQLRVSFYDTANCWFFGSTWIGSIVQSVPKPNGLHTVSLKERVYFQSNVNDYTTTLVIELVDAGGENLYVFGWSFMRIFAQYNTLTDTDETAVPVSKRLDFYYGTPLALLHIPEPVEEYPLLQKIEGCCLIYTLQTHEELHNVSELVPRNVLVNGDDIIPGVQEEGEEENDTIDILRSPVQIKRWPCHFTKLSIYLKPTVDQFEDYLCALINKDRLKKDNIQPDGGHVNIVERKLKVGVHNSWDFISAPHIVYLEREYSDTSFTQTKRSSSRASPALSNTTRDCQSLVLRSRLEVNEMLHHPLVAVVFQLEYVVGVPIVQPEIPTDKKTRNKLGASFGSMPLSQKITIPIRVVIFIPFKTDNIASKNVTLPLKAGVTVSPFGGNIFTDKLFDKNMKLVEDIGRIEFVFVQTRLKKQESMRLKQQTLRDTFAATPSPIDGYFPHAPIVSDSPDIRLSGKPPIPSQTTPVNILPRVDTAQVVESPFLNELPRPQLYSSIIVSPAEATKNIRLSRVAHSLLHTVEYPKIFDTQGNLPFIVDPEELVNYDVSRETRDLLHANEILFQFLAVSKCYNHKSVFFTYQFYRFAQTTTERLHLKKLEDGDDDSVDIPYVLQKTARDGNPSKNHPPGLTLRYTVDPSFLQAGEKMRFLKYLHQQKLYIDVWDGDSLMLIGSCSIPLKFLLRQGKPAVQFSQEVNIIFSEYAEGSTKMAGDMSNLQPSTTKVSIEGNLFIRCGNIGSIPDTNFERLKEINPQLNSHIVQNKNVSDTIDSLKSTAKLLSDCDVELAAVLLTRKDEMGKRKVVKEREKDIMRKKKIDRMNAVRQLHGGQDLASSYILQKEEKVQRTRDLRTIQMYREKIKSDNIATKLEENITVSHLIHSSLGRAEFFEYSLHNPYPDNQVVIITTDDEEMSVITNPREWRFYKQLTNMNTPMEEQMFTPCADRGVKVFIRGNETVNVPLKFQSFTAHNVTPEIGPSHPLHTKNNHYSLQTFGKDTTLSSKQVKIKFTGNEGRPLSILKVTVELHPHPIDQTFRFYHPEQTFLKKSIRLPPWQSLPGGSVVENQKHPHVVARCTDDNAICEAFQMKSGEPQEIFVKTPVGLSPSINRFFVVLFIDEFSSTPCQIWQLYINSLQRIDVSSTEGESTSCSLLLKGTQSSRMVKCFSSHPHELKISPSENFMLMANSVQEISLKLNSLESGRRMMFLNVVDQEFHQLVKCWLIMVTCVPPEITKVFEIALKVGGGAGSNKKISFMNPYPVKKTFHLKTNREDLLIFKEEALMLGGGESHNIVMYFLPQQSTGDVNIFVFINNKDGKNEETFCIKAHYIM